MSVYHIVCDNNLTLLETKWNCIESEYYINDHIHIRDYEHRVFPHVPIPSNTEAILVSVVITNKFYYP